MSGATPQAGILPDPSQSFSSQNAGSWAAQIGQLNQMNWDFVRFRVLFDLDANGAGIDVNAARPSLLHLRVPDRF